MRICYLASPDIHTVRWAKYFADRGHEVHLITSAEPLENLGNIKVHLLNRKGSHTPMLNYLINSVPMMLQFKKMLKEIKPDILHAHFIMETTLLGATSGFHPFVVTPWGSDILVAPQKSKIARWIVKYVLKRADLITCDAEHIKVPLVKLGADPQKIKVIYFGVDTKKFKPRQTDNTNGSLTVISLRRLSPIYDVGTLINAIPMVLRDFPTTKFVIAGDGIQKEKLTNLVKTLGVLDSVRFVGWVSPDELPKYLNSADIYVSTSLSDAGLASSTSEAMACGLPVIITDFGDNRKWVKDGVNGFIIPLKNPETLASKITSLIKDKEMRKRFGKINREIITERNDWGREMGKMDNLYTLIANKDKWKELEDGFSSRATVYHKIYYDRGIMRKLMLKRLSEIMTEVSPKQNENILEVGCGSGAYTSKLLKKGSNITVIDISAEMIEVCRNRIEERGYKADFHQANISDIPIQDNTMDKAIAIGIMTHLPEKKMLAYAINEMLRTVKLGGTIWFDLPRYHPIKFLYTKIYRKIGHFSRETKRIRRHLFTMEDIRSIKCHNQAISIKKIGYGIYYLVRITKQ